MIYFDYAPWMSIVLGLIGIALLLFGIVRWWKRQQVADEMESIALERGHAELRRLTEKEQLVDVARHVGQSLALSAVEVRSGSQAIHQEPAVSSLVLAVADEIDAYLDWKKKLFSRVASCLTDNEYLRDQLALGDFHMDFVVEIAGTARPDIIVALKPKSPTVAAGMEESIDEYRSVGELRKAIANYWNATSRRAIGIFIEISDGHTAKDGGASPWWSYPYNHGSDPHVRVVTTTQEIIVTMECSELRYLLQLDEHYSSH